MTLWYRRPAGRWLEALPIGNGRIGVMVFGGIATERLALNESTFWSGAPSDSHENPDSAKAFQDIRALFKAGRYQDAQPLIGKMLGRQLNYGTSLPAGDLFLDQAGVSGPPGSYQRELDLDEGTARVRFEANGITYRREILASHPDGVLAIRLTADHPGSIHVTTRYSGWKYPWSSALKPGSSDTVVIRAQALESKHSDGHCGTRLAGLLRVIPEGGSITTFTNGALQVVGADAVTVLLAMNTDFQGRDASALSDAQLGALESTSWAAIRSRHVDDHRRLFRRVTLDVGGSAVTQAQPTDVRLAALKKGAEDPQLAALFFQFARYLTLAGSRADSPLPLHLQGIWNDSLAASMGWTCDYHLDINTEQNYWMSEVGNLSECGRPLFRFVESLQSPGHRTAQKAYGIQKGWVCHVFSNPWGFTAPGWWTGWGLHVVGGVWISSHLWEHYQYTQDRDFLAKTAYPVLKGSAEFFLEYLYQDPTLGCLATGPSVSPELGGELGPGCVHDYAMIQALFSQCIEASETLGIDNAFRASLIAARSKLPPYKIGRNGQLQEWAHRDDGGETNHRHTSHLVGLFPLSQITPRDTPDLARAADKSLEIRMGRPGWEDVEWSAGNAVCYQARLGKPEAAHKALINLLTGDTDVDLLTFSRGGIAGAEQNIFALDGNTSGAAGIAEMLLQSQNGIIELLPALPKAWPNGAFHGLRARGGFEVDAQWKQGKLIRYTIRSERSKSVTLRYNGRESVVKSSSGLKP